MYNDILRFWFDEIKPSQWWTADDEFDQLLQVRFGSLHQQAAYCELSAWRREAAGRLAEIIILDQFSRNIYRNQPKAFAQDSMALVLAQEAIAAGVEKLLSPVERSFLYMPFMHSESRVIHETAVELFAANGIDENYDFELKHKVIIDRFGRYPHRNEILQRESTPEEIEFLKQPGSRF